MPRTIKNLKINFENDIFLSDKAFIVAHKGIDLDGLGSAVGLARIVSSLGKEAYIIIDESDLTMDPLVKKLMKEKCSNFRFVNKKEALELLTGNDLLILTDVSQASRICMGDCLDKFARIQGFDHHQANHETLEGKNINIIDTASSASEIVSYLMEHFQIHLDPNIATVILAGINCDTKNYTMNRTPLTLRCIASLMEQGGDDAYITQLFIGDFSETLKRYEIASRKNTEFRTFQRETILPESKNDQVNSFNTMLSLALAIDHNIRNKINLAQAADFLLEFSDAAIAMAPIDENLISVHGRSKGQVNIGELFTHIGGGGSAVAAGALLEQSDLEDAKKKILTIFPPLSKPKKFE